ncbi:MAG: hypothetical protein ACFB21_01895 [Opitutales bacterium]
MTTPSQPTPSEPKGKYAWLHRRFLDMEVKQWLQLAGWMLVLTFAAVGMLLLVYHGDPHGE